MPPLRSRPPAPALRTTQQRSDRIKLRRALGLLVMTLVLPGSAQLAAGSKTIGRLALRTWVVVWALLLVLGIGALVWREGAMSALTSAPALLMVQVPLVALGIGWALLFIDAWRLAQPPELARRHRLGIAGLSGLLALTVAGSLVASASLVASQRSLMTTVFAGGGETSAQAGRYNILLLGGDAGKGRTGLRPDSLTVASVDAETGRTVLIGLPRNMEDVPFSTGSPMRKRFPQGFSCDDGSCMLNAVYAYASTRKGLYPDGVKDPGAQATKEAAEGVTGLKINYYAMVDLKGFEALIDAVGGIRVDVKRRLPIGGGTSRIYGYIEKGENQLLDGRQALWFARSRSDSSDYDRMARQKCVTSALLNQLGPVAVLANFNRIAAAGKETVETDIPPSKVATMVELALKAKERPVSSVAFVPPTIDPGNPNFPKMRKMVATKITQSRTKDKPSATPTPTPTPTPTAGERPSVISSSNPGPTESVSPDPSADTNSTKRKKTSIETLKPGQQTDDLASVCSAN